MTFTITLTSEEVTTGTMQDVQDLVADRLAETRIVQPPPDSPLEAVAVTVWDDSEGETGVVVTDLTPVLEAWLS